MSITFPETKRERRSAAAWPGALAATMAFYGRPDKGGALKLKHRPTCAVHRGRACVCEARLDLVEQEEVES